MKSFKEFWIFYLDQHQNRTNRVLHVLGTTLGVNLFFYGLIFNTKLMLLAPVISYGFAWFGHFVFEKNKPATFSHPFRSLIGDFKMTALCLTRGFDMKKLRPKSS